jgi:diguanylate cyclase (GGDEF)-like protein
MEKMFEKPPENELEKIKRENLELRARISKLEKENLELKEQISKLEKKVIFDDLTGAFRRNFFEEKVQKDTNQLLGEDDKRKEGYKEISILFSDVDNFKQINDKHGHSKGDQILKEVVRVLKENLREVDVVGRFGGDEFVIEMLGANKDEAKKRAESLRKTIKEEILKNVRIEVSLSFGIAELKKGEKFEEVLKKADEAMYLAKKKKEVVLFDEIEKS